MRFSWRWFWRELCAGELSVMIASLIIAIAAVSGVGFFAERVQKALNRQVDQLVAADLVLSSDHPITEITLLAARRHGLRTTTTMAFPSMVIAGEHAQLSTIKAVSSDYPLRGNIKLIQQGRSIVTHATPASGEIWADANLLNKLSVKPGDRLTLGDAELKLSAITDREPDAVMDVFSALPHIMINIADLPATGLIQPGSRIHYRLLMAGEPAQVEAMKVELKAKAGRGERIEDPREGRPEIKQAVEQDERFLRLSTLMSVYLAAAAVLLASRRFIERHIDSIALLRTMGMSANQISTLMLWQCVFIVMLTALGGVLLGLGAQGLLAWAAGGIFDVVLPTPGISAALQGGAVDMILVGGLCLPGFLRLRQVPPLRVLRRESAPLGHALWAVIPATGCLVGLMGWQAGGGRLALLTLGGMAATVCGAALLAIGALYLLPVFTKNASIGWRFGFRNLMLRPVLSVAQIVALSIGFTALMLLLVVRHDLIDSWRNSLAQGAPNRFVINLQATQLDTFAEVFSAAHMAIPQTSPMARARLTRINGRTITRESFPEGQARRLAEREFNLSWGDSIRKDNQIASGRAINESAKEWSVEQELASQLGIHLGDTLCFDIDARLFCAPVVNLRKVDWNSFRVNFFVTGSQALLGQQKASRVSSFHLSTEQAEIGDLLVKRLPNLTLIDVSMIISEVQRLIDAALNAVEVVFGFALLGGLCVLYAASMNTHDDRKQDAAILRTLGASGDVIKSAANAELLVVGGIAGGFAALSSIALGASAARWIFNLPVSVDFYLLPLGIIFGALSVRMAAAPLVLRVLNTPPMRVLR